MINSVGEAMEASLAAQDFTLELHERTATGDLAERATAHRGVISEAREFWRRELAPRRHAESEAGSTGGGGSTLDAGKTTSLTDDQNSSLRAAADGPAQATPITAGTAAGTD